MTKVQQRQGTPFPETIQFWSWKGEWGYYSLRSPLPIIPQVSLFCISRVTKHIMFSPIAMSSWYSFCVEFPSLSFVSYSKWPFIFKELPTQKFFLVFQHPQEELITPSLVTPLSSVVYPIPAAVPFYHTCLFTCLFLLDHSQAISKLQNQLTRWSPPAFLKVNRKYQNFSHSKGKSYFVKYLF